MLISKISKTNEIISADLQEASLLYGSSTDKSRPKLFISGKILHIMKKKKSEIEKKTSPTVYEMRWAQPEDFTELKGEIS